MESRPRVVYHGTPRDFAVFDKAKLGQSGHHPTSGLGFFFAQSPKTPNEFAQGEGGNVMPAYLRIQKPHFMTVTEAGGLLTND